MFALAHRALDHAGNGLAVDSVWPVTQQVVAGERGLVLSHETTLSFFLKIRSANDCQDGWSSLAGGSL